MDFLLSVWYVGDVSLTRDMEVVTRFSKVKKKN